jgi:hypothetical protein
MTHPKNNEYVRKWRTLNYEKHLAMTRKYAKKKYDYTQAVKQLLKIDHSLFN